MSVKMKFKTFDRKEKFTKKFENKKGNLFGA